MRLQKERKAGGLKVCDEVRKGRTTGVLAAHCRAAGEQKAREVGEKIDPRQW